MITGNTGYIADRGSLVVTYHLSPREIVLIDSGSSYSEKFKDVIRRLEVRVVAVLQTHLHEDHTAHSRFYHEMNGAEIYAPEAEIRVGKSVDRMAAEWGMENAQWQQALLQEYDYPMNPIGSQQTQICLRSGENHEQTQTPNEDAVFQVLHLPGHAGEHLGYVTPDGVCCLGDALLSHLLLRFAKMSFMYDEGRALETMKYIGELQYPYYVLAHKEIVPGLEIKKMVQDNFVKEQQILTEMVQLWKTFSKMQTSVEAACDQKEIVEGVCDQEAFVEYVLEKMKISSPNERDMERMRFAIRSKHRYLENEIWNR